MALLQALGLLWERRLCYLRAGGGNAASVGAVWQWGRSPALKVFFGCLAWWWGAAEAAGMVGMRLAVAPQRECDGSVVSGRARACPISEVQCGI